MGPTEDLEVVAVLDEDIYCSNETETNGTVNDESRPLFRTVENVQLDTMETYEQVKLIFASDCLYSFGLAYFVIICNFIPLFYHMCLSFDEFLYVLICLLNIFDLFSFYSKYLGSCNGT